VRLRLLIEDLGTTFIKMGQVLSTRVDLLPPEYTSELEKLLDQVPPAGTNLIKQEIERELEKPLDAIFAYFDPVPLASASIGQVHAAILISGEHVVVKVKRPGVQEQVAVDVDIIMQLARVASRRLAIGKNYDFVGIAREFTQTLLHELDYIQEGRNAERFSEEFKNDDRVRIPRIYWDYTTDGVITLERLAGLRINNVEALVRAGIDPVLVAHRSAEILLKQVFDHGYFHADPHPANFYVMEDSVIAIVDFGMVGYVDQETKGGLVELFIAISQQNPDGIINAYSDLGIIGRVERVTELRSDISILLAQYYGLSIDEIDIKRILNDVTSLVRLHNLRMPANLALLVKTIVMEESLVVQLDPNFNFAEATRPFARKLWEETYSPYALAKRALRSFVELVDISTRGTQQVRRVLGQVSRGEFSIVTNQPRLDEELAIVSKIVNRLIAGIIGAALLIFSGFFLVFIRFGRNPGRRDGE
jgi:ubiquinone biosynthesis protein